jgi:hypothetical protein
MGLTTVRIGGYVVKNRQAVLDWLSDNIGSFSYKESTPRGFDFTGEGWVASWKQYGAGWFMDVRFNDPKHAAFFTLRWK